MKNIYSIIYQNEQGANEKIKIEGIAYRYFRYPGYDNN